jgi:hypothetical protein
MLGKIKPPPRPDRYVRTNGHEEVTIEHTRRSTIESHRFVFRFHLVLCRVLDRVPLSRPAAVQTRDLT